MKILNRVNWKLRLIISVSVGVMLTISLLFGVTYQYFRNKLVLANEQIANLSFQQAEKDLKEMMTNAEKMLTKFSFNNLAWEFSAYNYASELEKSIAYKSIVQYLDEMLNMDANVYGFAILNSDGRTIVSTAKSSSGSGMAEISVMVDQVMEKSQEKYPFVNWSYSGQLGIPVNDPLRMLVEKPAFIGVRALKEFDTFKEDSYLLVSIREEEIEKSYERLTYNESQVALLNVQNEVISATNKELLGSKFAFQDSNQNIEYDLSYDQWRLINLIPKENYALESKDIRDFSFVAGAAALLCVLVIFVVWSRKYTRPIQNLMEQMDKVGKEQLDIEKPERLGWRELDDLNEEFYLTVQKLKGYIHKLQDVEQEKAREELRTLQYQINPHFLYNSINSIRWMACMTNNTKVADSLVILSKIINPILRNPSFTWSLEDELSFISNYVDMMRIRYGSYMEFELQCPQEWYQEIFPRFILQPVIENCFVHSRKDAGILQIDLKIEKKEGFVIEIRNNNSALLKAEAAQINEALERGENPGSSIGLHNVQKRLRLLQGEKGKIWMESRAHTGVSVFIVF